VLIVSEKAMLRFVPSRDGSHCGGKDQVDWEATRMI
jgi:hypothetical protein